jgi:hypothetical protein
MRHSTDFLKDLYRSVPVLLNKCETVLEVELRRLDGSVQIHKCDIPTTEGCNADVLLRTLQARPDLAIYTKNLWLLRCDRGFRLRQFLGWYDVTCPLEWFGNHFFSSQDLRNIPNNIELPWPVKRAALPLEQMAVNERISNVLRKILRLLPNVQYLHRTEYFTDVPWEPLFDVAIGATIAFPGASLPFTRLREVRLCCGIYPWAVLWPLFALPVLKILAIRGGASDPASPSDTLRWEGIKSSLELLEIDTDQPELVKHFLGDYARDPLYLMATACDKLQPFTVIERGYRRRPGATTFRHRIRLVRLVARKA